MTKTKSGRSPWMTSALSGASSRNASTCRRSVASWSRRFLCLVILGIGAYQDAIGLGFIPGFIPAGAVESGTHAHLHFPMLAAYRFGSW